MAWLGNRPGLFLPMKPNAAQHFFGQMTISFNI